LGRRPFTFLPDHISDAEYLGGVVPPHKVALSSLKDFAKRSLLGSVTNAVLVDDFFGQAIRGAGDETFSRAIGSVFLEHLGLNDTGRFLTHDDETLAEALRANTRSADRRHYLKAEDFYVAKTGRPFLIAGATVFADSGRARRLHTELTPFYSGTRKLFNQTAPIGGGYVETFGLDSKTPERHANGVALLKLGSAKHRFTLSDMIGTSGAASQEMLRKVGINFVGFPEFRNWAFQARRSFTDDDELSYGDGGHIENLGIMPLLARKLEHIIVFINSKTPFKYDADPRKAVGEGLVYSDTYDVRQNRHYGVSGYEGVRITWIYNERIDKWLSKLPFQARHMIESGEVKRFPHYNTFFQSFPKIIDLSAAEASLLAHMSCWNVMQNAALFD